MYLIPILLLLLSCIESNAGTTDQNSEKIQYEFSHPILINEDGCLTIFTQECNSKLIQSNHYILPTRVETVCFPFGTKIRDIDYCIGTIHSQKISEKIPVTSAPVIIDSEKRINTFNDKNDPLTKHCWFEYKISSGIVDGTRMLIIKLIMYPVQYWPKLDRIEWTEKIDINIDIDISNEPSDINSMSSKNYDLLILHPSEFSDILYDFSDYKTSRGMNTVCISLDEITEGSYFPLNGRDEPEQIKYFIKNAIEEWGVTYVLLIGGEKLFPVRMVKPQNSFISDLYYADIYDAEGCFCRWDDDSDMVFGEYPQDSVDFMPDVYLGRLACVNAQQVEDCVNKIIQYETDISFKEDWFYDFVVIAGDCFPNKGISEGESATQVALNIMDTFTADPLWASNGRLDGTDPTGVDQINLALNNGPGFLYYSGHSSPTQFFTYPRNESRRLPTPTGHYSKDHVAELINGDRLPIVVFDSCSSCNFCMIDDCLGWSFVSNPHGGGIGFFGATTYSLCYMGDQFTEGLAIKLALNFFDAYQNSNDTYLGQVWSRAIMNYVSPDMIPGDHITLMQWEPFIDPTLMIRMHSNPPQRPERPNGPASGKINTEYYYSSCSVDNDGDMISYLFDWDDGSDPFWIGPFESEQMVQINKTWRKKGEYMVRVKAKDINGLQSEWSDPLLVSISRSRSVYPNWLFNEKTPYVYFKLLFS